MCWRLKVLNFGSTVNRGFNAKKIAASKNVCMHSRAILVIIFFNARFFVRPLYHKKIAKYEVSA